MPAESAYREACEAACEWCGKGMLRHEWINSPSAIVEVYHCATSNSPIIPCTAPSIESFAQSQALARVAAEKRADAAEQERDRLKAEHLDLRKIAMQLCDALLDARGGMRYVKRRYGNLDGVAFERVETDSTQALRVFDAHQEKAVFGRALKEAALRDREVEQERDRLRTALALLYDKWENGVSCFEDPETCSGSLGHAFKLEYDEENEVLALLKKAEALAPAPATVAEHRYICSPLEVVRDCRADSRTMLVSNPGTL